MAYRSAQKLRRDNALSEITSDATLKATALANLGLTDVAGNNVAVATGKTFGVSNSLVLAGTDGTTMTFPSTSATVARTDAANTFTGVQTMTSPAITTPALTGTVTGTYTLGGTPTVGGAINTDSKVLAAPATYSATTTPATLFSWTVVPGTYLFEMDLPITITTTGGLTVNFALTTAVLTSIQYQFYASTAADNTTAVSGQGTTNTSGTKIFDSKAAAYTLVKIKGSTVVATGGTFAFQGTQNTSASGGDVSVVLLGAYGRMVRTA